ncbi:hypothetical protein FGIG_10764 [Fasciola gigantica]|uniref:Uncharacterized protein n=1 Tax=Fasciola gigantica TaxID=46835 RepID=A0A504YH41_FASGI|nr:hypothetical protein FGIG_10764 [Fasciola gigantica]
MTSDETFSGSSSASTASGATSAPRSTVSSQNASTTGELSDNYTECKRFNTAFNANNWLDCAIDQQSLAHELLKSIQRMPYLPPSIPLSVLFAIPLIIIPQILIFCSP